MDQPPFIEKRAILHVHTRASDGTGTIQEVIDFARNAGVDILGINDHNTLDARERGFGGFHSSLFVLAGAELEDSRENSHMLVYGLDRLPNTRDTHEQLNFVNSSGGLAIAAHPTEEPGRLPRTRSYSWTGNTTEGLAGVEVWNYMSLWKKDISFKNLRRKLKHPDDEVEHPDPAAVEFWRNVGGCAVAGPDAHALRFGAGRFRREVFPYPVLFRRLMTHILLEREPDGNEAEEMIIDALKRGRCFTSNLLAGDARGFRAGLRDSKLHLRLPGRGRVVVIGAGGETWTGELDRGDHVFEESFQGPIAISVLRKGRTWIFCGLP